MCKVMAFTNLVKVKSIPKLVNAVARALDGEDDGFGYAIQGPKGAYGERSLNPENFKYSMKREVLPFSFLKEEYNRFGTVGAAQGAGIFHTRTSTNDKTLINTHPIIKHGWALIHNGVVTNHGPKYEMLTTNDTEHVLEHLVTGGIKAIETHLTGYYGVAALDPQGNLHVFRDDRAPLYFAHIIEIDSYVFATTEASIEAMAKAMKWEISVVAALADNHYLVYANNAIVSQTTFKPRGSGWSENRYADLSLGESTEAYETRPYRGAGEVYDATASAKSETHLKYEDLGLSEDEILFLEEVELYMDHSYRVLDHRGDVMEVEVFMMLSAEEQLCCTVIRGDGTVCDQTDYGTDRLYDGRAS